MPELSLHELHNLWLWKYFSYYKTFTRHLKYFLAASLSKKTITFIHICFAYNSFPESHLFILHICFFSPPTITLEYKILTTHLSYIYRYIYGCSSILWPLSMKCTHWCMARTLTTELGYKAFTIYLSSMDVVILNCKISYPWMFPWHGDIGVKCSDLPPSITA